MILFPPPNERNMWHGLALAEKTRVPFLSFLVQSLPVHDRGKAADTMAMEAYRRVQDPVYGCAGVIVRLQEEIRAAQSELARTQAQIAAHQSMNAQLVEAPPPQKQAGDDTPMMMVQQEPFHGLDALFLDDVRAGGSSRHGHLTGMSGPALLHY
jgi:hypothetical protein